MYMAELPYVPGIVLLDRHIVLLAPPPVTISPASLAAWFAVDHLHGGGAHLLGHDTVLFAMKAQELHRRLAQGPRVNAAR